MGLSRTYSEKNGDLSRKSQNFLTAVYFATLLIELPLSSICGVEYSFEFLNKYSSIRLNRKFCSTAARALSSYSS